MSSIRCKSVLCSGTCPFVCFAWLKRAVPHTHWGMEEGKVRRRRYRIGHWINYRRWRNTSLSPGLLCRRHSWLAFYISFFSRLIKKLRGKSRQKYKMKKTKTTGVWRRRQRIVSTLIRNPIATPTHQSLFFPLFKLNRRCLAADDAYFRIFHTTAVKLSIPLS